ncbi:hypothetical protein M3Y98_00773000 [Aphelenchoides besseyi]|nr:hypothetical protein M3Y98_00773000 [Aphelenchoides besseyi]KAI6211756.1 hypothetical protein M3Y96_00468300 [Aphelenchoides besseyi]
MSQMSSGSFGVKRGANEYGKFVKITPCDHDEGYKRFVEYHHVRISIVDPALEHFGNILAKLADTPKILHDALQCLVECSKCSDDKKYWITIEYGQEGSIWSASTTKTSGPVLVTNFSTTTAVITSGIFVHI